MNRFIFPARLFLCTLISIWFSQSMLYAQESPCEDVLATAEEAFFNAAFTKAASSLEECLEAEAIEEPIEELLLLAQIYYATQDLQQAHATLVHLFDIEPDYVLDRPLPPPFMAFFEGARVKRAQHMRIAQKMRPAPDYGRRGFLSLDQPWYWIGGGALVAGTAIVLVNGSGDPDTPSFPPPPGPPGGRGIK